MKQREKHLFFIKQNGLFVKQQTKKGIPVHLKKMLRYALFFFFYFNM